MDNMQIINIGGVGCYELDGIVYLLLDAVVTGLGFTKTDVKVSETGFRKEYVRIDWPRVNKLLADLGFPNKWGKGDFIPENVFYRLAMKAKNPVAEAFQAKVADEIIPSIRKHGAYIAPQPTDENSDDLAIINGYKALMRKVERLQSQIDLNKPKVEFADALLVCENCIYIEELAKLLCQIGMRTGRNRLFEEMAADGFLCIRNGVKNMPTQRCVEAGWLVIEKTTFEKGGVRQLGYTTKVTPKGIQYFIGYYKRKHGLEPMLSISKRSYGVRQLKAGHSHS